MFTLRDSGTIQHLLNMPVTENAFGLSTSLTGHNNMTNNVFFALLIDASWLLPNSTSHAPLPSILVEVTNV